MLHVCTCRLWAQVPLLRMELLPGPSAMAHLVVKGLPGLEQCMLPKVLLILAQAQAKVRSLVRYGADVLLPCKPALESVLCGSMIVTPMPMQDQTGKSIV